MNAPESAAPAASTRPLWWARLASLLSIAPLGVWTVNHLIDNLAGYESPEAWERAVTRYANPWSQGLTLTVVLLPLVIHTVWGVQRLFSFKPNNLRQRGFDNARYLLQRLSAVGVLFFIPAHLWLAMLEPRFVRGHAETFEDLARHMRYHPPTLWVYVLGTLGVTYHLANGLSGFVWTWGLVSGRRAQRKVDAVAMALFALLLSMAWGVLWRLWSAGDGYPPLP